MKNNRAAIYVRCSTTHQNLDIQLNDLRKYAEAKGLQVMHEFSDFGVSGAKDRRPALDELMKSARKRRFDSVLVWRFDRLGRNTRHLLTLFEEFEALQIGLVSLNEGVDLSTSLGRVMATVLSALASFERDLIRERVIAGIQNAKNNGVILGRPSMATDVVEKVKQLRSQGCTFREIQKSLGISPGTVAKYLSVNTNHT